MNKQSLKVNRPLLIGSYIYLTLPVIIFLAGWCKWYIGFPAVLIVCISLWFCIKEHSKPSEKLFIKNNLIKYCAILLIVLCWVTLSGVGGYVWQNPDQPYRNAVFNLLVEKDWPVIDTISVKGISKKSGLVYYIGFWLPAAVVGKIFGLNAGYAVQYIWAVIGILLFYALICTWRRKIVIWPLWIIIFFSGADAIGTLLNTEDGLQLWGITHLERWAPDYQFSSMTTQLFWVFNQAIPAWLASALIFLSEKPKNLIFTWSLIMITSTLPFAGLLPFIFYFLITRSEWGTNKNVPQLLRNAWKNWGSIQNILGGGIAGFITMFYLIGNVSVGNSPFLQSSAQSEVFGEYVWIWISVFFLFLAILWGIAALSLRGKGKYVLAATKYILLIGIIWNGLYVLLDRYTSSTHVYEILHLLSFYLVEAGIYLICLKDKVEDKALFGITAIWLLIIPLIKVGSSQDFCMRASIPALILIMLWCIDAMDTKKRTVTTWILIGVFLIGSVTPLHEIKRTYVNSRGGFIIEHVDFEELLSPGNFSGDIKGIFWEGIAK